jgi:CheY-like chemotaxis protein
MTTVLLIDDEPGMGPLVSAWVADMDVQVVQADGLEEALRAVAEERPGAILLDLNLGEEDGLSILPRLQEEPALANVPVVAFTVHDSREQEARQKGVIGFVAKPFRPGDLRAAISGVLA